MASEAGRGRRGQPALGRERGSFGDTKREGFGLSWVAGSVDGLGYVLLHVFTAHVTGNTVHTGTGLGRLRLGEAGRPAFAIAAFFAGVVVGTLVREACARRAVPVRAVVFGLCGAFLVAFVAIGLAIARAPAAGFHFYALAAPAAMAMGCQNAVTPRVDGQRVRTYITGTVSELAEALVLGVTGMRGDRAASLRRAVDLLGVWVAYLLGSAVSGAAGAAWGIVAAVFPIAGLGIVVSVEVRRWREGGDLPPDR